MKTNIVTSLEGECPKFETTKFPTFGYILVFKTKDCQILTEMNPSTTDNALKDYYPILEINSPDFPFGYARAGEAIYEELKDTRAKAETLIKELVKKHKDLNSICIYKVEIPPYTNVVTGFNEEKVSVSISEHMTILRMNYEYARIGDDKNKYKVTHFADTGKVSYFQSFQNNKRPYKTAKFKTETTK